MSIKIDTPYGQLSKAQSSMLASKLFKAVALLLLKKTVLELQRDSMQLARQSVPPGPQAVGISATQKTSMQLIHHQGAKTAGQVVESESLLFRLSQGQDIETSLISVSLQQLLAGNDHG